MIIVHSRLTICIVNPSKMSQKERQEHGIKDKLPTTLEQSLAALETDKVLEQAMGTSITKDYVAMKRAERTKLNAMSEEARRIWLIERY